MISFQRETNARVVFSGYRRYVEKREQFIRPYSFDGRVNSEQILKGNPISCLSAFIKPDYSLELPLFGNQVMRNDLVFFYRALMLYGDAVGKNEVLATYVMRSNSLSRNKLKAIKWQWKVYRQEAGLSLIRSAQFLLAWAFYGYKKYWK